MSLKTKKILRWALTCCSLLASTILRAQTAPPPAGTNWEVGLRLQQLTFVNLTTQSTAGIGTQRSTALGMDVYALRNIAGSRFIRGAVGWASGNQYRTYQGIGSSTLESDLRSKYWHLNAEFGAGIQVPRSHKPHFDKLQLRSGLLLHATTILYGTYRSTVYELDSLGTIVATEVWQREQKGYLSLQPALFFQLTCDLLKRCRLGLEWKYGPVLAFNNNVVLRDPPMGDLPSQQISLNWNLRLPSPVFSIAYTF